MPTPRDGARSHRKGQYSCNFCRSRKLRCDRPLPCTNCASRGNSCLFEPIVGEEQCRQQRRQQQRQQVSNVNTPESLPQPVATITDRDGLLAEIQALRKLAENLEKRVATQTTNHPRDSTGASFSPSNLPTGLTSHQPDPDPSGLGQMSDVVAHLERVSMGHGSYKFMKVDDLVVRVDGIHSIPGARSQAPHCVMLPQYGEAKVLLDAFVTSVSYIHHVVHHPSLPGVIEDVYRQVDGHEPLKLGHLVLLLSIIASTTHVWVPRHDVGNEKPLFISSAEANAQTSLWIKATYDVLNSAQNGPSVSLETVQGIIILSFLICNLEGVSLRYRSLISTGLLLSRELGLHHTDDDSKVNDPNTVQVEIGRRVWWYLAATDWFLAARYGNPREGAYQTNPRHMAVKKPLNINDANLTNGELNLGLPITQLTDMSYFLQRIRLAEISRSIVDQYHDQSVKGSTGSSYHSCVDGDMGVMNMNTQLEEMICDIPSFLRLESYEHKPDSTSSAVFIQAYMLNSIMHTQRCKLHLGYLTSRPKTDYASSREMCLESARQIMRGEAQLEKTQHPFLVVRQRLSGILYAVFMAGIVLLMDDCVNGRLQHDESCCSQEAAEALRIIDDARGYSPVAADLYKSLTQVLAKYRHHQQQVQQRRQQQPRGGASSAFLETYPPSAITTTASLPQIVSELQPYVGNPTQATAGDLTGEPPNGGPISASQDQLAHTNDQISNFCDPLNESLEGLMELDGFPWEDIFSEISSTSIF